MVETANKTLNATGLMPSLTVDNLQRSVDFFNGLGFDVQDRWEENGVLLGVMLKAGGVQIGLSQDDGKKGKDRVKGAGMRLYLETRDDIDELARRAKASGIALKADPQDTEWGSRAFDVLEPSGFLLTITSPSKESSK